MRNESQVIAEQFAGLSTADRRRFISLLRADGLSFSELPIVRSPRTGAMPLSYAQARQWFLWRLDEQSTAYHMSTGLRLRGRLDEEALRASFITLVARHESLRTVFNASSEGVAEQIIQGAG